MPKYALRRDNAEAEIKLVLRQAGYVVEQDGEVDLLVRHPTWIPNYWVKGECKTKITKRATTPFKPRRDQYEQDQYCIAHCIPYWLTAEQALQYLNEFGKRLKIGGRG